MLGKTHVMATTAIGSAGIFGLYLMMQSETVSDQIRVMGATTSNTIGLPLDNVQPVPFMFWYAICLIGLAFGALLPDVDSPNSQLGRYVPWLSNFIGHRTITHTIWVLLGLLLASYFTGWLFLWMVTIGYFLHIFEDSFSTQGIAWLWPLGKGYRRYGGATVKNGFHVGIYRVGGTVESVLYYVFVVLHVYLIWRWSLIVMPMLTPFT